MSINCQYNLHKMSKWSPLAGAGALHAAGDSQQEMSKKRSKQP